MLLELKRFLYRQPRWVPYAMVAALIIFAIGLTMFFALTSGGSNAPDDSAVMGTVDPDLDRNQDSNLEPDVDVEPDLGEDPNVGADTVPDVDVDPNMDVEPQELFVNPLTGELETVDMTTARPYAIMLNNLQQALPQLGVSQADVIFELPAEGGITRMLGVFQSVEDVGMIGSVRSARDYYVSIAAGLDAFFLHAGGSPTGYEAIKELGVDGFDCINGPYEGSLYWRDAGRISSMGFEHSVVTSGSTISTQFATYSVRTEHQSDFVSSFQFAGEEDVVIDGADIGHMALTYSYYKTGLFDYDEELGEYLVSQYGEGYVDGNDDTQVSVKNVLVLRTDVDAIPGDTAGQLDIRLTGTGSGIFLCEGQAVEISWARDSDTAPFQFFHMDGTPLLLAVGTSYVNVVDESCEIDLTK